MEVAGLHTWPPPTMPLLGSGVVEYVRLTQRADNAGWCEAGSRCEGMCVTSRLFSTRWLFSGYFRCFYRYPIHHQRSDPTDRSRDCPGSWYKLRKKERCRVMRVLFFTDTGYGRDPLGYCVLTVRQSNSPKTRLKGEPGYNGPCCFRRRARRALRQNR